MRSTNSLLTFFTLLASGGCVQDDGIASQSQGVGVLDPGSVEGFTATETWDPYGILGTPVGSFVSGGDASCPGHEPTGDPLSPCPPGSRIIIRGFKFISREVSSDPRATGWISNSVDVRWGPDGAGSISATIHIDLDAGGSWDGKFSGIRTVGSSEQCPPNTPCWIESLHGAATGTGGIVDGMHFESTDNILSVGLAFEGHIVGRLVTP